MISQLSEEFYKIVASSRDLIRFNFHEIVVSNDEKNKQTIFESSLFRFYISLDEIRGELSIVWKKNGSHEIIPDPIKGIFFFSTDPDKIFYEIENSDSNEDEFSIIMKIYRNNSWIFTDHEWLDDPNFKFAISKTDEWALSEFKMLELGEYEKTMLTFKKKNTKLK